MFDGAPAVEVNIGEYTKKWRAFLLARDMMSGA